MKNFIQRCLLFPDLSLAFAELRRPRRHVATESEQPAEGSSLLDIGAAAADRAEKEVAFKTLEETGWNRKAAAKRLNISYKTLLNKLQKWEQAEHVEEADRQAAADTEPRWLF